jgi:photosystem II stability/assembly factor-like uncharacterized protein
MYLKAVALFLGSFVLSIAFPLYSENGSASSRFERIGPFGGDVRSLLMNSHQARVVYLGSSGGKIFKSSDAGKTWAPLTPGIGQFEYVIDTLVQHPTEPEHLYAGAWDLHSDGGGLFESTDAGATWQRVTLPHPFSAVRGFEICRNVPSHMIVGTLGGVFITADGGRTWNGRDRS